MISGSRWAGSLGLSRYNKTFLPYLLVMTSCRDDKNSWKWDMIVSPLAFSKTSLLFASTVSTSQTTWQTYWEHGLFYQLSVVHTVKYSQKNQVTKLPLWSVPVKMHWTCTNKQIKAGSKLIKNPLIHLCLPLSDLGVWCVCMLWTVTNQSVVFGVLSVVW